MLVRRSRAAGLPAGLPDVHGLAVRVPVPGGRHGDLLLATTGLGLFTRFVLAPVRDPSSRPMTTLLPYRTPTGPRLVGLRPAAERAYEIAHAPLRGSWQVFGELVLSTARGPDPLLSFDAVANPLPGLENYEWVRRLRQPAYATARRSR